MAAAPVDRYTGCLLGLALGDALGAMRFTDDTQMALDLAESLAARGALEPDDMAARFAASYAWSRGYGPSAAKVLRRIRGGMDWRQASRSVHAGGSFGNGAAMRAPVVALWCAARPATLAEAARATAIITHAHPLGVEGAVAVAAATLAALAGRDAAPVLEAAAAACPSPPCPERFALAQRWLRGGDAPSPREVARQLGNGIAAADSAVTAVYVAARFLRASFVEMHAFVVAMGGDVDTIAAMAGGIWGAGNGEAALPADALARLEQRERIRAVAVALHAMQHPQER